MKLSKVGVRGVGRRVGTMVAVGAGAVIVAAASLTASAQSPPASPAQSPQAEAPRLRIATTAVEIDAVVSDRDGRPIADLQPPEFELYQDGRKQRISSIRYVPVGGATSAASAPGAPASGGTSTGTERRTVAIVIDDLTMSFNSTASTREALRRFIERDVQPGDLVSVVRTAEHGSRTQWFTDNKEVLLEAVGKLKYNLDVPARGSRSDEGMADASIPWPQSEAFTFGTLGTVNAVVRAMRPMPGRKAVLLATDGFRLTNKDGDQFYNVNLRLTQAMQQLADDAARSFVVLYTLNTKRVAELDAIVSFHPDRPGPVFSEMFPTNDEDGPQYLARIGGGFHLRHASSLDRQFARVLDDQRGYYLLTYEPDEATFTRQDKRRPDFHDVKVVVTRAGARVRSRPGFFGIADAPPRQPARNGPPGPGRP